MKNFLNKISVIFCWWKSQFWGKLGLESRDRTGRWWKSNPGCCNRDNRLVLGRKHSTKQGANKKKKCHKSFMLVKCFLFALSGLWIFEKWNISLVYHKVFLQAPMVSCIKGCAQRCLHLPFNSVMGDLIALIYLLSHAAVIKLSVQLSTSHSWLWACWVRTKSSFPWPKVTLPVPSGIAVQPSQTLLEGDGQPERWRGAHDGLLRLLFSHQSSQQPAL